MTSRPIMVEIIGLAGSGKSTLTNALCQHSLRIVAGKRFAPTALENIPFCARHFFSSCLPIALYARRGGAMSQGVFKKILYLNGWHRVLRRQATTTGAVIILDQGPVFKLANLHGFGPEWLKCPSFAPWWDRMFKQWAAVLDAVVWLDAPGEVLVQRIHSRHTRHAVKGASAVEAVNFLSRYQSSCEYVISRLAASHHVKMLRFDTSRQSPKQIVSELAATLNLS